MDKQLELKHLTAEMDGYRVHGYENDYIFSGIQNTSQYYEIETLQKWTPLLGEVKTLYDIGANLGNHSLYWAKHLHPGRIVSFEPFPMNYDVLHLNITENGLSEMVTAEMLAVGESSGYVSTQNIDVSNLGATTFAQLDAAADGQDQSGIKMTSVDSYSTQHGHHVDFMKIDTEGFEISVLKGAIETIRRDRPAVWVEVTETSHAEVRAYLQDLGYRMIDIRGFNVLYLHQTKTNMTPLFDLDSVMDMMYLFQSKTNLYYGNYNKAKQWLAAEKEKTQRATENYETAKQWLAAEKEKSAAALKQADEERAQAEMNTMQLQFLMQRREEESYDLQRGLTQRIVQTEKELREAKRQLQSTKDKLAEKTLPPIWYTMAGSRIGRALCKLFRWYHGAKRRLRR